MKKNQASLTSLISSFGRAYHSQFDKPKIFNDTIAIKLMTTEEYNQITDYMISGLGFFNSDKENEFDDSKEILKWVVQTQVEPTPIARARYCEDKLKDSIAHGIEQYVILGAGMDTFAYRNLDLSDNVQIFEVDHPDTQNFKIDRVNMAGLDIPKNLHYVPMDFTQDILFDELKRYGFSTEKRTFFSWLGVTYYLSSEQNINMLNTISAISPKGSLIIFDYADENLFKSNIKRVKNMVTLAQGCGEPMKSCYSYDELKHLLNENNFSLTEHLTSDAIEKKFFDNRNDYLHAFENINYALAVVR
ncbi:class I SAM-dependent methyltransferase [Clostridioides sp. ZZV15-6598]|uniref:class I SAM-dependent methyltransferase n=1 Tax=Clostridioides sp. ZZV15-6598 TaxID=2811501 RepID=UPI001D105563|nr:class I SAM-dependent methyltransferase [Clostridioides sp. ZZV15-6598]